MNNENINIADILRDCPKGTKLYSPLFGECIFVEVWDQGMYPIRAYQDGILREFTEYGKYCFNFKGECTLFPSSSMRDWSKFFKRGDIVSNVHDRMYAIFDRWGNDQYTRFHATYVWENVNGGHFYEDTDHDTAIYQKSMPDLTEAIIKRFEEHYQGKYNPDTLQVDHAKPEYAFKPFDKVLVCVDRHWTADIYSHKDGEKYMCIGGLYDQCIPYEGNEHLLGTSKDK